MLPGLAPWPVLLDPFRVGAWVVPQVRRCVFFPRACALGSPAAPLRGVICSPCHCLNRSNGFSSFRSGPLLMRWRTPFEVQHAGISGNEVFEVKFEVPITFFCCDQAYSMLQKQLVQSEPASGIGFSQCSALTRRREEHHQRNFRTRDGRLTGFFPDQGRDTRRRASAIPDGSLGAVKPASDDCGEKCRAGRAAFAFGHACGSARAVEAVPESPGTRQNKSSLRTM